jgi:hypothetical protein
MKGEDEGEGLGGSTQWSEDPVLRSALYIPQHVDETRASIREPHGDCCTGQAGGRMHAHALIRRSQEAGPCLSAQSIPRHPALLSQYGDVATRSRS